MYVSLHAHTIFSALDGHALIKDYISKVKSLGHTHAAITDHGTMAGVPEFVNTCIKNEVIPIIGVEMYVEPRDATVRDKEYGGTYHLTVLAQNEIGYKNLVKLSTFASSKGFYKKPRVDWKTLQRYNEGLIVLSGCTSGELAHSILSSNNEWTNKTIDFYKSTFGDRYFLEWQNHGDEYIDQQIVNKKLFEINKNTLIKSVATNDSHFCDQDQYTAQQLLIGIRRGQKIEDVVSGSRFTYVRSNEEMVRAFGNSKLIENTLLIGSMISSYKLGDKTPKLAISPLEVKGEAPTKTLLRMVKNGLENRLNCEFINIPNNYLDRLDSEIEVIEKLSIELGADFSRYLLMIADICRYCKQEQIRFGPRGSAAGSLVCWALGISEPDPIKDGLYFERFLNPFRVELPDVDLDFADDRRSEVFAYIRDTYGEDNVAKIGTYAMIGARQALKDSAHGLMYKLEFAKYTAEQLIKLIPDDPRPGGLPLHEVWDDPINKGRSMHEFVEKDATAKELMKNALLIEGRMRGDGMHAAGVVIANQPIKELLPLGWTNEARKENNPIIPFQTQYEMQYLEGLGLLKVDILGLKTLSVLDHALRKINKDANSFIPMVDPWKIPWDDEASWDLIKSGRTLSLFQIGSEGLGGACYQLQPDNIEDLALTVAVYRPGPMQNFSKIVNRKKGLEEITSIHPSIDHIIKTTYGFPVYQEQVMEIARTFAGYSLGEADLLRKAMGKKIREKMAEEKVKFVAGSIKNGHTEEEANYIWEFLVPFADYGFNRAHAICYAYVAYQTAYIKSNYPQSFYSAAMTVEINTGGTDTPQQRVGQLVREARSILKVLPPNIQYPCVGFEPEGENIRYGLSCIKGIGEKDAKAICEERKNGPFLGLVDFAYRCATIRRSTIETLVKVGACDDVTTYNRRTLVDPFTLIGPRGGKKVTTNIGQLVERRANCRRAIGQINLLDSDNYTDNDEELGWTILPEYNITDLLLEEQQHLGIFNTALPETNIPYLTIKEVRDNISEFDNTKQVMMGVLTKISHTITKKKNETMAYASLLDESDFGWDLVIFHKTYDQIMKDDLQRSLLEEGQLVHVSGSIRVDNIGKARMFVDQIWPVDIKTPDPIKTLTYDKKNYNFESNFENIQKIIDIFYISKRNPGNIPLNIKYGNSNQEFYVNKFALVEIEKYMED